MIQGRVERTKKRIARAKRMEKQWNDREQEWKQQTKEIAHAAKKKLEKARAHHTRLADKLAAQAKESLTLMENIRSSTQMKLRKLSTENAECRKDRKVLARQQKWAVSTAERLTSKLEESENLTKTCEIEAEKAANGLALAKKEAKAKLAKAMKKALRLKAEISDTKKRARAAIKLAIDHLEDHFKVDQERMLTKEESLKNDIKSELEKIELLEHLIESLK